MAPHAHSLSKRTRTFTFLTLVVVFFVSTPLVWMYANGIRPVNPVGRDSATSSVAFVQTGGFFIGVTAEDTIFVDDKMERGSRLFSSARYIDGMRTGEHRVYVQHDDAHTWVKNLVINPKFVTEAYAFNLATSTSVRMITQSLDTTNTPLLRASSTIEAKIINDYRVDKTAKTYPNNEYTELMKLFVDGEASTTASSTTLLRAQERVHAVRDAVQGIVATTSTEEILASRGDIDIIRRKNQIIARYSGSMTKMPYYFCAEIASTTPCVPEIVMDTQSKEVTGVVFYPSSNFDALIMTRTDGVVVTEIDPRGGFQNTQPFVYGQKFETRLDGSKIYLKHENILYEIVTK